MKSWHIFIEVNISDTRRKDKNKAEYAWTTKLKWMIMLLAILIKCCSSSWPSSVSSTSKIESGLYSFSEFSTTKTFRLQFGMISGSMYILDYVSSPTVSMVVRRINSDDSISWSYAISSQPSLKSLAVDSKEVNVYVMPYLASSLVLKFDAKTGALVRADLM